MIKLQLPMCSSELEFSASNTKLRLNHKNRIKSSQEYQTIILNIQSWKLGYLTDIVNQQSVILEELIRNVFEKFERKGRIGISKKQILKILYNVKMDLPEENKIKEILAFYWYKNGPYSPLIIEKITMLSSKKMIQRVNRQDIEIYKYSQENIHTRIIEHDDDLSQTISLIIEKINEFKNMNDTIHSMYSDNAPYNLYTSYKNEFSNKFENFCKHIFANQDISSIRFSPVDIDDCFIQVILDIPHDKCFRQFMFALNLYSQGLFAILSHKLPYDQTILNLLQQAYNLREDIWNTFASGVRIQHHDSYYNDKVDNWQEIYDENVANLRQHVDVFNANVFEKIKDKTKLPKDLDYPNKPKNIAPGYPAKIALEKIKEIAG